MDQDTAAPWREFAMVAALGGLQEEEWPSIPLGYLSSERWGTNLLREMESRTTGAGDLAGLWDCDASLMTEGRPGFERVGCMVPLPGAALRRASYRLPNWHEDLDLNSFLMGAQSTEPDKPGYDPLASDDERPPHPVTLSPFWIQRMEVSLRQYRWCIIFGPCRVDEIGVGGAFNFDGDTDPNNLHPTTYKQSEEHPANGVTWEGARRYCEWVGGRLPTEAEWEYAARSGPLQHRYPWGDTPPTCRHATFKGSKTQPCAVSGPVASFPPDGHDTPSYILHQAGNVWEWTADWYAADYYARSPSHNPKGPTTGTGRVQRGGSFSDDDPAVLRGAFRAQMDPTLKMPDVGFRCAADAIQYTPYTPLYDLKTHGLAGWAPPHTADTGTWRTHRGLAVATIEGGGATLRWLEGRVDATRAVTMRVFPEVRAPGSFALLYGVQDHDNHYRAEVYPRVGIIRIIRVLDGVEGVIAETTGVKLPPRWWFTLTVRWDKGLHRLAHSTLTLAQGEDTTWTSGGVGMRLSGHGRATFEPAFTTP